MRIVLVWLLAAALPLQGIAAAGMANCGPDHFGASDGSAAQLLQATSHVHAQASAEQHHHHVGTVGASGSEHKPAPTKAQNAKCSLCASCCTAAAIPSLALEIDAVSLPNFFASVASTGAHAFLTSGQERPPRTLFA